MRPRVGHSRRVSDPGMKGRPQHRSQLQSRCSARRRSLQCTLALALLAVPPLTGCGPVGDSAVALLGKAGEEQAAADAAFSAAVSPVKSGGVLKTADLGQAQADIAKEQNVLSEINNASPTPDQQSQAASDSTYAAATNSEIASQQMIVTESQSNASLADKLTARAEKTICRKLKTAASGSSTSEPTRAEEEQEVSSETGADPATAQSIVQDSNSVSTTFLNSLSSLAQNPTQAAADTVKYVLGHLPCP